MITTLRILAFVQVFILKEAETAQAAEGSVEEGQTAPVLPD